MRSIKYVAVTISILFVVLFFNLNPSFSKNSKLPDYSQVELHKFDRPTATPLVTVEPKINVKDELVIYGEDSEKSLIGYLSYPENKKQENPAILVIHEWWGLNDNIKSISRRLAGEGYTVLAVDLYKGAVADTPERARELVTFARNNTEDLNNNIKQAYEYLENTIKAPKIASLGWCFGGTWSLNTALLFPNQLDAAVIYYGGGITTEKEVLKSLEMPILGIFAELDNNPNITTVKQFESSLKELGKNAEIHIYPNVDHAFANPSGTRYNAEAAENAWQKTLNFLTKYL